LDESERERKIANYIQNSIEALAKNEINLPQIFVEYLWREVNQKIDKIRRASEKITIASEKIAIASDKRTRVANNFDEKIKN
jgi:hypothetical protein